MDEKREIQGEVTKAAKKILQEMDGDIAGVMLAVVRRTPDGEASSEVEMMITSDQGFEAKMAPFVEQLSKTLGAVRVPDRKPNVHRRARKARFN